MPFYSWPRMTRVTSMGRIYASTVGCLPPTLWFQESLRDRLLLIILVATRAGTAGSAFSVYFFRVQECRCLSPHMYLLLRGFAEL